MVCIIAYMDKFTGETIYLGVLRTSSSPRPVALLLVLLALSLPLALPLASAATYSSTLLPGDQAEYGQVAASWSSTLPPNSVYDLPSPVAQFLNVTSVHLVVENVSGSRLIEALTFTYSNQTVLHGSAAGDVATGNGNLTLWTISAGLRKGDHLYASSSSPTINDTFSTNPNPAGVPRWVNVLNQTFNYYSASVHVVTSWDNATGILVQFSYSLSVDLGTYGSAHASASVNLTGTNLWSATPDFKLNANALALTAASRSSQNISLTVSSLDGFAGNVQLLATAPAELTVSSLKPSSLSVSDTSPGRAILEFSVPATAPEGSYVLSVSACSPSPGCSGPFLSHTLNFTVYVTGDFDISTDTQSLTIPAGSSQQLVISLKSYSLAGAAGLTASFSSQVLSIRGPNRVTLTPGQSSQTTVVVSAQASAALGTYSLVIAASKGSVSHSVTETVILTAGQQGSILGLDPPVFYSLLVVMAAIIVGLIAVRRRGEKKVAMKKRASR